MKRLLFLVLFCVLGIPLVQAGLFDTWTYQSHITFVGYDKPVTLTKAHQTIGCGLTTGEGARARTIISSCAQYKGMRIF